MFAVCCLANLPSAKVNEVPFHLGQEQAGELREAQKLRQ